MDMTYRQPKKCMCLGKHKELKASHGALLKMLKTVHFEGAGRYYEQISELIKKAERWDI